MENKANDTQIDSAISDEQLEEVAGGNSIQKRRLEQLNTHDSSKSIDNVQKTRLEQLDEHDSSK
ncbi:hypothetical protein S7335_3081 [Synechococcus sp. PCC 7335]|uniref:hypothetical protein n=1 Tax=Synechococcus sp. (strain ATCC 29403 / PCC 7335) TaxID=91464 RepID=UPI00017EE778|nr:hypothetical protein [Synechococcus sp. PCC 7335]EDX85380.1 hypothetical protein S7335_3081 [Synechococcus sp. PCC 7335]